MKYRSIMYIATVALSLQSATASAAAQDEYPSRPVKIVVPMPPASAPDIRVRLAAEQLGKMLTSRW